MKQSFYITLFVVALAVGAYGQKLGKPTLTPVPPTSAQSITINEGVKLHDAKKYVEAIAKYRSVLAESPDCAAAMYELAFSLMSKGDKLEAIELAYKGTKYIGDELPLFYVFIANELDDYGKPQEAINIYLDGIKVLAGDTRFGKYRGSLYYNLGVTYVKQKKYPEARQALKSAVESDFGYASPHYLLAVVFNGTKYQIPAFLAAARLISLEYNTQRTGGSVEIVAKALQPSSKDPKTGNITINLDFSAPKDEGDFGMFDLLLPTLTTIDDKKGEKKSDNQRFIDAIDTVVSMLSEDKKIKSTFVGKTYVPFMVDMKNAGHIEAFGNMVLFIRDNNNAEAAKWIDANGPKLQGFLDWSQAYKLPAK